MLLAKMSPEPTLPVWLEVVIVAGCLLAAGFYVWVVALGIAGRRPSRASRQPLD